MKWNIRTKRSIGKKKIENNEAIKLTPDELQQVVDYFSTLRKWDNELFHDTFNNAKIKLRPLFIDELKDFIGKKIWIAVTVKETVQMKDWDFYYKLETTVLKKVNKKLNTVIIEDPTNKEMEIEVRRLFAKIT